jgi:integrase
LEVSSLSACFTWAVQKDLLTSNNARDVIKPLKNAPSRERWLDDAEIVKFWQGCDQLGWPFGPLFQLLLLTAQREREVGEMRWSELSLGKALWTIPGSRTKNSKTHQVHLSALALKIIEQLPNLGDFVFMSMRKGNAPVVAYGDAKERLDKIIELATPWVLHDLRRTATVGMVKLNVPPHVADKVLNHSAGTIRGVAAVYDRHKYEDEREDALKAWGRHVATLGQEERRPAAPCGCWRRGNPQYRCHGGRWRIA